MQNEAGGYVQFDVSGRCLSLKGFDKDNGVPVLLWDCVNQENQMWKIVNGVLVRMRYWSTHRPMINSPFYSLGKFLSTSTKVDRKVSHG